MPPMGEKMMKHYTGLWKSILHISLWGPALLMWRTINHRTRQIFPEGERSLRCGLCVAVKTRLV